jgi:hypothetical protein
MFRGVSLPLERLFQRGTKRPRRLFMHLVVRRAVDINQLLASRA